MMFRVYTLYNNHYQQEAMYNSAAWNTIELDIEHDKNNSSTNQ